MTGRAGRPVQGPGPAGGSGWPSRERRTQGRDIPSNQTLKIEMLFTLPQTLFNRADKADYLSSVAATSQESRWERAVPPTLRVYQYLVGLGYLITPFVYYRRDRRKSAPFLRICLVPHFFGLSLHRKAESVRQVMLFTTCSP